LAPQPRHQLGEVGIGRERGELVLPQIEKALREQRRIVVLCMRRIAVLRTRRVVARRAGGRTPRAGSPRLFLARIGHGSNYIDASVARPSQQERPDAPGSSPTGRSLAAEKV
jgi:hypothetical protein